MSKLRADSAWCKLTAEQRETLEGWFFEENIGYREALERAQKVFGVTASVRSLSEYYQRLAEERTQKELLDVKGLAGKIEKAGANWEDLGATAMTLVAKRMLQLAVASPGKVREMASLGRLLVSNEAIEIKRRWVELEEEKREDSLREKCDRMESTAGMTARLRELAWRHLETTRRERAKESPGKPSI